MKDIYKILIGLALVLGFASCDSTADSKEKVDAKYESAEEPHVDLTKTEVLNAFTAKFEATVDQENVIEAGFILDGKAMPAKFENNKISLKLVSLTANTTYSVKAYAYSLSGVYGETETEQKITTPDIPEAPITGTYEITKYQVKGKEDYEDVKEFEKYEMVLTEATEEEIASGVWSIDLKSIFAPAEGDQFVKIHNFQNLGTDLIGIFTKADNKFYIPFDATNGNLPFQCVGPLEELKGEDGYISSLTEDMGLAVVEFDFTPKGGLLEPASPYTFVTKNFQLAVIHKSWFKRDYSDLLD